MVAHLEGYRPSGQEVGVGFGTKYLTTELSFPKTGTLEGLTLKSI